jgi:D-alanine transaminase
VLIVRDGAIVAPPKDNLILPGITYDATFDIARELGVPIEIRAVSHAEALGADEMWLSSSSKEVLAITQVDGKPFAGGTPGPVFRRVWASFQSRKRA